MKYISIFIKLMFFLAILMKLPFAYAVGGTEKCVFNQGASAVINLKPTLSVLSSTIPVGGTIYSQYYWYDNIASHQAILCGTDPNYNFNLITVMSGTSSYGSKVYDTNIEGVGVRMSMYSSQPYHSFPTSITPAPFNALINFSGVPGSTFGTGYLAVFFEIIKTSNYIGSGTLSYSVPNFFYAQGSNQLTMADLNISANIEVDAPCKFDQSTARSVELGNVDANSLSAPGSTANAKAFSLGLSCTTPANVSLAISGTSDPAASDDGVLKLDGSSKAKGVGVQILHDGKGVAINGKLPLGQLSSGSSSVSLQARVYRTNEALVAGPFSAVTTVSIVYQ